MIVAATVEECRQALTSVRKKYAVGFVPTMGALHQGHLSLIRRSKSENPFTVASLYVNPTQFGPAEDFAAYPRTPGRDAELAEEAGADLLWAPTDRDIYPEGFSTFIEETALSRHLCGAFRPGHFRGVCTVVYRLLHVVRPDRLYLGQKDAQQLRILEKMVEDLDLGVKVVGCPTLRDPDGLAMSSRNAYLSPDERALAPALYAALSKAADAFARGERHSAELIGIATRHLQQHAEISIQYIDLRQWSDFGVSEQVRRPSVLAAAVWLGKTRLIDNVLLNPAKSLSE